MMKINPDNLSFVIESWAYHIERLGQWHIIDIKHHDNAIYAVLYDVVDLDDDTITSYQKLVELCDSEGLVVDDFVVDVIKLN